MTSKHRHVVAYKRGAASKFQTKRRLLQPSPRLIGTSKVTHSSDVRHLLLGVEEKSNDLCAHRRRIS